MNVNVTVIMLHLIFFKFNILSLHVMTCLTCLVHDCPKIFFSSFFFFLSQNAPQFEN